MNGCEGRWVVYAEDDNNGPLILQSYVVVAEGVIDLSRRGISVMKHNMLIYYLCNKTVLVQDGKRRANSLRKQEHIVP